MGSSETLIHLVKDLPEIELARAVLATVREPLMILDGQIMASCPVLSIQVPPEEVEE
jgi:hypothetical protein